MPKIEQVVLRCANPDGQRSFYCNVLGMTMQLKKGAVEIGKLFLDSY